MHLLLSGTSPGSIRLSNFHLIWLEPLPALHICRHRCCKVNLVSTDRMSKCKSPGMEQWSFFPKRMRVIQKIPGADVQLLAYALGSDGFCLSPADILPVSDPFLLPALRKGHCPFSVCFVNAALNDGFGFSPDRQINGSTLCQFS